MFLIGIEYRLLDRLAKTIGFFLPRCVQLIKAFGKKKICKDLKVLKGTLDIYLCELNRYIKTQSIRWFHSPGHKGFIQTAGFSPIDDVRVLKGRTKRTISEVTRTGQTRHIVKIKEEMKSLEEKKQRNKEILLKIYT